MKLYSITVYYKEEEKAKMLKGAYDLIQFGYFQRKSIQEFMIFTGRVIVERSTLSMKTSVSEQGYMCHCYIRADGLSAVSVCDHEYPQRVAFNFLTKVMDDFASKVSPGSWSTCPETEAPFSTLESWLIKYQDPNTADPMTRVQNELEETKGILTQTIEQVLQRGEKLDDLVAKSDDLSAQSQMFYKSAKKMNKCCSWV